MRVIFISFLLILNGCSSLKRDESEVANHISDLKFIISNPIFNETSKMQIKETGYCKLELISDWSKEVSKRKGYSFVKTSIEVNFTNNYKNSLFISAHDENEDGKTIQKWNDRIEINLLKEVEVTKYVQATQSSKVKALKYYTDYVSIGVSDPDNIEQIALLLDAINSISSSCKSL